MPKPAPVTLPWPPWSHPADKQLSHSMKDLNLQPRPHESRSRAWWDDAPTPAEEKLRKQVRFDVEGELGNDPMFPQGLTLFLVEGTAREWDDAPSPSTPMPEDSQWPPQHCPTYTGGARPKVPAWPPTGWSQSWPQPRPKGEPDPINHPSRWVPCTDGEDHPLSLVEGTKS